MLSVPDIDVICDDRAYPLEKLKFFSDLNYREISIPLISLQEYIPVNQITENDIATMFTYGSGPSRTKIILDNFNNTILVDIIAKEFQSEGKIFLGIKLKSQKPVKPSMFRIDF